MMAGAQPAAVDVLDEHARVRTRIRECVGDGDRGDRQRNGEQGAGAGPSTRLQKTIDSVTTAPTC